METYYNFYADFQADVDCLARLEPLNKAILKRDTINSEMRNDPNQGIMQAWDERLSGLLKDLLDELSANEIFGQWYNSLDDSKKEVVNKQTSIINGVQTMEKNDEGNSVEISLLTSGYNVELAEFYLVFLQSVGAVEAKCVITCDESSIEQHIRCEDGKITEEWVSSETVDINQITTYCRFEMIDDVEFVESLIGTEDINKQDDMGELALNIAVKKGDRKLARTLSDCGRPCLNPFAKDSLGKSAFDVAEESGNLFLAKTLKDFAEKWKNHISLNDSDDGTEKMEYCVPEIRRFDVSKDERIKFTNTIGMHFVRIEPGSFTMGSPKTQSGRNQDEICHQVTITKGFYMQATTVTQTQWQAVMGNNPSQNKGDDLPVENVSWFDACEFVEKLNRLESAGKYRLPTEAEWEYACRAGTNTKFYFGEDEGYLDFDELSRLKEYGWYRAYSEGMTEPVGQRKPNGWGLYDMLGNVDEWCQDWYGRYPYPPDPETDPVGPASGRFRVRRGESVHAESYKISCSKRGKEMPNALTPWTGFRVVMDLP